jgi:hypothetical protein
MKFLSIATAAGLGVSASVRASEPSLAVDKLSHVPDLAAAARAVAVDYPKLVRLADAGDARAFGLLVWLTDHAGFDGAASEGHAEILWRLMQRLGDERATAAL